MKIPFPGGALAVFVLSDMTEYDGFHKKRICSVTAFLHKPTTKLRSVISFPTPGPDGKIKLPPPHR
jgi:hypothetical protein